MTDRAHDYEIIRHAGNPPGQPPSFATYGRFYDAGGLELCVTLERPWVDADKDERRDRNVSRFEPGLYKVTIRKSRKNGGTGKRSYDVPEFASDDGNDATRHDTPDTTAAQVHLANFPWELNGCVATGTAFGNVRYTDDMPDVTDPYYAPVRGQTYPGVTGSKTAFQKVMADILGLMARERRDHVWIRVTDRLTAT